MKQVIGNHGPSGKTPILFGAWLGVLVVAFTPAQLWSQAAGTPEAGALAKQEAAFTGQAVNHWAFQPLRATVPPVVSGKSPASNPIDAFIAAKLNEKGLSPNPPASKRDLIRRVFFDLIGLPPSPEQVEVFINDKNPDAWERLVDELLKSPRHGERWAQHWLDVVRYADTDGFEVNTERKNAWPYRDYVIGAFNNDTPYDQFIREQLAGDALGEDAATGFLVAAAALLPGQIGQDDVSKRLARQDDLSEMVGGTGEAFLGLSIGCARCHNHKFDPIPQRDYYSMQAFFAGVRFGERPLRSPEADAKRNEAEGLKPRLAEIDRALARFEPLAQVSVTNRETNARLNEETFTPLEAKFVRFTIHDANLHPSLGLIEPCVDEFEIFTAEESPRNVALANLGTKVTASGSRTSKIHRLEHINDGRYGNNQSWMSDEAGRGWVLFELPEKTRIGKVAWSRDREGKFNDRLATAYTLEAGSSPDSMTSVAFVSPLRTAVNPRQTTDRFAAVFTKRLRFTILACSTLEPCLDELEVFTAGSESRNIALANAGTKATASSTTPDSDIHRLEHINDGRYGNARSWISHETGQGWVELEFVQREKIGRVVWGRDREGKFTDRLATAYRIEVTDESGAWKAVASSQDRKKYAPEEKTPQSFSTAGLGTEEAREAKRLLDERKSLESKIASLAAGQMVFAGKFDKPEVTRVLHRGDPEQPRDEVAPAVLTALGSLTLTPEAADQERRLALASWIASPENPLTARVMANRIWQGHFGLGLVETASDFGISGTRPSHPQLLDWLAAEFTRAGWSIKHMHRLITTSATYRQSSRINRAAQALDADARLLWRFPSRRLEAETIRDTMLAVSGRLNLKMGGAGFNLFSSRGGLDGFPPVESFSGDGLRRMIYAHKIRMEREAVFGAFDCPDAGQSTPRRRQSTTPIQALNLFNSRFTIEEAEAFATRVKADAGENADHAKLIQRVYQLALGRDPERGEIHEAKAVVRDHGLPTLCRVLFNSNEFLFLP